MWDVSACGLSFHETGGLSAPLAVSQSAGTLSCNPALDSHHVKEGGGGRGS